MIDRCNIHIYKYNCFYNNIYGNAATWDKPSVRGTQPFAQFVLANRYLTLFDISVHLNVFLTIIISYISHAALLWAVWQTFLLLSWACKTSRLMCSLQVARDFNSCPVHIQTSKEHKYLRLRQTSRSQTDVWRTTVTDRNNWKVTYVNTNG